MFLQGAAVGLTTVTPVLWVQPARAAGEPRVVRHVGVGADPKRQAVVSFAARTPFRRAWVEYGPDDFFGSMLPADVRGVPGVATRYGHVLLRGLEPGTRYRYRVRLDGVAGRSGTVTTAPAQPAPFTFTAFGDQGVSHRARAVVSRVRSLRPAVHLVAGDLCYAARRGRGGPDRRFDPRVWDRWLAMIEPVAARSAWMCATGNHEMEPGSGDLGYDGYLTRFLLPGNGAAGAPSTYGFTYGTVGFLCLDSNDVSYELPHNRGYSGGRQTRWLDRRLARLRAPGSGIDFVVVVLHHCVYSTNHGHGSEGGVREQWVPLFDRHGVDLVVNGHAHNYERTSPLRGGQVVAEASRARSLDSARGTTYITAGGGGAAGHDAFVRDGGIVVREGRVREREPAPWTLPTRSRRHALLAVEVIPRSPGRPATMAVRAVDADGRVLDHVTLTRSAPRPVRYGRTSARPE
jgi:hypothetical protein